jgi:regulatory protein
LDDSRRDAYVAGLTLLARRELSEKQVRQRLRRKEFADEDVEAAIARLTSERALDDTRFAHALARQEILTKRHGRLRAQRQLEAAGVSASLASAALDEALAQVDQDALIESALSRRLRGDAVIDDQSQFRRLYRFLIGQGFESERVLRTLKRRRSRTAGGETH